MNEPSQNEKSIIFSSDMVRAILDGRKTQTRRVIKDLPPYDQNNYKSIILKCPYGKVGGLLWVRENIRTVCYPYQDGKFAYGAYLIEYAADEKLIECPDEQEKWWRHNWRERPIATIPLIHMPKWVARIWLEITSIRVERVQDISDSDCTIELGWNKNEPSKKVLNERVVFCNLWDSLNAKRGFGWEQNPWVWKIEFRKVNK